MNRPFVIWLVLLVVAAALGVLFYLPIQDREPTDGPMGEPTPMLEPAGPDGALPTESSWGSGDPSRERVTLDTGTEAGAPKDAIRGRVVDEDGRPIPDAKAALFLVNAFDAMGFSRSEIEDKGRPCDADGRFQLATAQPTFRYRVGVVAPGFAPYRTGPLSPGSSVEITLEPAIWVEGTVELASGEPVADARVMLSMPSPLMGSLPDAVATDPSGRFRIAAPGAGSYVLRAQSASSGAATLDPLEVRRGMDPIQLVLDGRAGFLIRLLDEANAPVAGVTVRLESRAAQLDPLGPREAATDEHGETRFAGLADGAWLLRVEAEGYAPLAQVLTRTGPGEQLWEGRLVQPGALRVQVMDADRKPVRGFPIQIHSTVGANFLAGISPLQNTSDDGVAEWPVLVPGRYVVRGQGQPGAGELAENMMEASVRGGGDGTEGTSVKLVTVTAGTTTEIDLQLWDLARCRVQILLDGRPYAGAQVRLRREGLRSATGQARGVRSASDGWAELPPVWPGLYALEVQVGGNLVTAGIVLELGAGELLEQQVELPSGLVRGSVSVSEGSEAQCRASLVGTGESSFRASQPCDASGRFAFEMVPEGRYLLTIQAADAAPWTSPPLIHDGLQALDVGEIALQAAAFLTGQASGIPQVQEGGFDLRFAELKDASGSMVGGDALDVNGGYRIGPVAPGSYRLTILAGGATIGSVQVELRVGENRIDFEAP